MSGRMRMIVLALTMASIAVGVGASAIFILYETSVGQQRERLVETAKSQARLIEAIARYNARQLARSGSLYDPEILFRSMLGQIREAHDNFDSFGTSGEFSLGKLEGEQMVVLLSHRGEDLEYPKPIPFTSEWGEPMRQALLGKAGTMVGIDYRGKKVLAAHEPVKELNLGIVAKIDLAEIRSPFIRAGIIASGCGIAIITVGLLLFLRIGNPIARQLEESERKYRGIFESSSDFLLVCNPDGTVQDANPAACSAYGSSNECIPGRNIREMIVSGKDEGSASQPSAEAFQGLDGDQFESVHRRGDGSFFPVNVRVSPLLHEGQEAVLVAVRDMTEWQEVEDRLQKQNLFLRNVLESLSYPFSVINVNDFMVELANSFARARGMLEGKPCSVGESENESSCPIMGHPCPMAQVVGTKRAVTLEDVCHDGNEGKCFEVYGYPIIDRNGNVVHLIEYVLDKTERKLAEERIRTLSAEIIDAQEKERKLVAQDIHDGIGSTLAAIKYSLENNLAALRRGLAVGPESLERVIETVQMAIEESRRISTNLRPSILDDLGIVPTIRWFCGQFQELYSDISLTCEIDVDEGDLPELMKLVYFRVLQESLSNVAKHSAAAAARVTLSRRGDNVELSIRDNGRGFNHKEQARYKRIGDGLGIAGMRERVELAGGKLSIDSEKGKGTTITVISRSA